MIKKQIIYYKNLIFFKIVLYSFVILLYSIFNPLLQTHLQNLKIEEKKIHSELQSLQNKYDSMQELYNNQNLIYVAQKQLQKILLSKKNNICPDNKNFQKDYDSFNTKYNLINPIKVNILLPRVLKPKQYYNEKLTIKNTDILLDFSIQGFYNFILLTEEAYKLLPQYTSIVYFKAMCHEVINPNTIQMIQQDTYSNPIFILGHIHMQLSEIITLDK